MRPVVKTSLMTLGVVLLVTGIPSVAFGTWWLIKTGKIDRELDQAMKRDPKLVVTVEEPKLPAILILVVAAIAVLLGIIFIFVAQK
jgi:hypothetical protein